MGFGMTDQEKNEALATFAGFAFGPESGWGKCWTREDGQHYGLPDLLHSLDAQAKWLWPKLNKILKHDGWSASWTPWFPPERQWSVNIGRQGRDEEYFGATLAEACAEAILSLIGEGE